MKKTKIVATIGPASEKVATLKKMVRAGMNVVRLNFSHGSYKNHKMLVANVRKVEKQMRTKIGIVADIQGPRIRVASKKSIKIKKGEKIFLTDPQTPHQRDYKKQVILDWNGFYDYLSPGKRVYIEDGLIQLEVTKKTTKGAVAKVLVGDEIKPRKGVNIPAISHHLGFLTDKDLLDLEFALYQGVDFVAASFVSNARDLESLRRIIGHILEKHSCQLAALQGEKGSRKEVKINFPWIISKIERATAIKNIKGIIQASDGILIARGDLAIEEPQEKVAVYQKDIIQKCREHKKPVIVATQMMASMVENARPTRAEISDVTNAVVDNADAVMLSNESAVGRYPVETVETMSQVVLAAEKSPYNDVALKNTGKFGKMLFRLKKENESSRRRGRKKVVRTKKLEELLEFSVLRQEDVKLKFTSRDSEKKRKACLVWGAEV